MTPEEWLINSLRNGSEFSGLVAERSVRYQAIRFGLASPDEELSDVGSLASASAAYEQLQSWLDHDQGAGYLLAEQMSRRAGDAWLSGREMFLNDCTLECIPARPSQEAVALLRASDSGWLNNAFLLSSSPSSIGIEEGEFLTPAHLSALSKLVRGIIVSAFDGEAYVLYLEVA